MHKYVFEKFEKDKYGNLKNQLVDSQIHEMKSFRLSRTYKCVLLAKLFYEQLLEKYRFRHVEQRLIINILATAIDEPNKGMTFPYFNPSSTFNFEALLKLLDKLESAKLVQTLTAWEDGKGIKKPLVVYPTISKQSLIELLEAQKSKIKDLDLEIKKRESNMKILELELTNEKR